LAVATARQECEDPPMNEISKGRMTASWVLAGLVGFGLLASGVLKIAGVPQVVENFEKFHLGTWRVAIGLLELVVAALFLVPKTRSLGTLLVTGYFGGAIVAHLTTDAPAQLVAPLLLGGLAWAANYLRTPSMFESLTK
jgi:DoxX-like family